MPIGVAGFGKMGSSIAARLAEVGREVLVWNRTAERARKAGFETVDTPRALAGRCDVVISSLFDAKAVKRVYLGEDGLIRESEGKLFIEVSTVEPQVQVELASAVSSCGGSFIECPVGGTTGPARSGQLLGLVGGDIQDFERARPILDFLCRRIEHVGSVGSGALTKLAVNLPLIAFWQAFGEAMALMRPLGKDPAWLVELFADTAGAPSVMRTRSDAIIATLGGLDTVASFDIDSMRKDVGLMLEEAVARGISLPVAGTVLNCMSEASAAGWGKRDCVWIPAFWASKGSAGS